MTDRLLTCGSRDMEFEMSNWRKKQATLIYYFSSMDYLLGLQKRLLSLRGFSENLINVSQAKGRDRIIKKTSRWGRSDTTENWINNSWRFLADFQLAIARDITDRAAQIYHVTGTYQCGRGMAEYSTQWMAADEQKRFDKMFAELSKYAGNIDDTMHKSYHVSRWDDFGLAMAWQEHKQNFPMLPMLKVHTDIVAEHGRLPSKTGVYVSADDPDAALQFAWTGSIHGKLLECTTFNSLGKAALRKVGRTKLWLDGQAMLNFVIENKTDPGLQSDSFFEDAFEPDLAPSFVACNAFTSHPSRWYYVELIPDEFEPVEAEPEHSSVEILRFEAGSFCQKAGMYVTPAQFGSQRKFELGEIFPESNSQYGKTIWQWDGTQNG